MSFELTEAVRRDSKSFSSADDQSQHTTRPSHVTLGRRFARRYFHRSWYNPLGFESESSTKKPSIEDAWDHFERIALPRCFLGRTKSRSRFGKYIRAKPGEMSHPTKLYPIFATPQKDLDDFGIGISLYFEMIKFLGCMAFVAGLINIPSILYFSERYSSNGRGSISKWILSGSAVCTNVSWEACPSCLQNENDIEDDPRLFIGESPVDSSTIVLIKKNQCELGSTVGIINLVTIWFAFLSISYFIYLQQKKISRSKDQNRLTSKYSVVVKNPPPKAKDPEKWRAFFERMGENVQVAACTVALDNKLLLRALIRRRQLLYKINQTLPDESDIDLLGDKFEMPDLINEAEKCLPIPSWQIWAKVAVDPMDACKELLKIDKEIKELSLKQYKTSRIYVTFKTKQAQRMVLRTMTKHNNARAKVFCGIKYNGKVLDVSPPAFEPDDILWDSHDEAFHVRYFQQAVTLVLSTLLITGGACMILYARKTTAFVASMTITILNMIAPRLVGLLSTLESHPSKTNRATSLYFKMTLFRWINTACIAIVVTPFTSTIENGAQLIDWVSVLLTIELVQRPILQILDMMGTLKRHFLGPRAIHQKQMNTFFGGSPYDISERYTDITKILVLTFSYSTLFPPAYFFMTAIIFVCYWLDKFRLLRTWRQLPLVDDHIAHLNSHYLLFSLLVYAVMASYTVSQFPYDNVCQTDMEIPSIYIGEITINTGTVNKESRVFHENDVAHTMCNQNLFRYKPRAFPPLPSFQPKGGEWMTDEQVKFAYLHVGTLLMIMTFVAWRMIGIRRKELVEKWSCQLSEEGGGVNIEGEIYGDQTELDAYTPQLVIPGYEKPIDVCRIDANTTIKEGDLMMALSVVRRWGNDEKIETSHEFIPIQEKTSMDRVIELEGVGTSHEFPLVDPSDKDGEDLVVYVNAEMA